MKMRKVDGFFVLLILIIISCGQQNPPQEENIEKELTITSIEGFALGTTYLIKYENTQDTNYSGKIAALLDEFENSLSTFRENSVISQINSNTSMNVDELFTECFNKAVEVSENTLGAFDMTVAPLVNAWGFGFTEKTEVDQEQVRSILKDVGFEKIKLVNGKIIKDNPNIMLDASAIAKGQSVDIVKDYLLSEGIKNFLVEIGGEVYAKGMKKEDQNWIIGIDKPIDNSTINNRELQEMIKLEDKALATSGNYRQFYIKDGIRYSHTIDPKTGYPVSHSLLSVTVLADDCMTADAYATAFMVLGYEKSIEIINADDNLDAYFILSGNNDQYRISYSDNFEKMIYQK